MRWNEIQEDDLAPGGKQDLGKMLHPVWKAITNDCQQFLSTVIKQDDHVLLYRGMNGTGKFFKGKPWDNRKPVNTRLGHHNFAVMGLELNGVKANRNNSISCTTRVDIAANYGSAMWMIFPLDGFHYTWGRNRDLIGIFDADTKFLDWMVQNHPKAYDAFLAQNPQLDGVSLTDKCSEAIQWVMTTSPHLTKEYWASILASGYLVADEGLQEAMEGGYEIMVNGTFYAVHREYEPQIRRYLRTLG